MSKAEERALEVYPKDIEEYVAINGVKSVVDNNSWQRAIFLKGYRQAEKDLELTWEDIGIIISINQQICGIMGITDYINNYQQAMEEVLKRFKDYKDEEI